MQAMTPNALADETLDNVLENLKNKKP